tara:strand:- start:116 stop:1954 length:1839 start_codon:yes stop_codon:yes gene_type:complete
MDAFFADGSSWGAPSPVEEELELLLPACVWSSPIKNTYLAGYVAGGHSISFPTLKEAQDACLNMTYVMTCNGVVSRNNGTSFELRAGLKPIPVPASDDEASYLVTNWNACAKLPPADIWKNRSAAAYSAVTRADGPTARWVYQGYALVIGSGGLGPYTDGAKALERLHSFTEPIPEGQFILLDMSAHGQGMFKDWKGKWALPFIWTALHTYGGAISIKGNLTEINRIPFDAPPLAPTTPSGYDPKTQAVGVGYTPEGLDQNPTYYELLQEAAFKAEPEANITDWLVKRAHRRYGLHLASSSKGAAAQRNPDVTAAWVALGASGYAVDEGVSDATGVGQMAPHSKLKVDTSRFEKDLHTPERITCLEWDAWGSLNAAAPAITAQPLPEPFVYDLVNTAREVLAQLSTPMLVNFSIAIDFDGKTKVGSPSRINATGDLFVELLTDLDRLLATDGAFMLGPWLARARKLGGNATDCVDTRVAKLDAGNGRCDDYMEWNARAQLTTWYPTLTVDQPMPGQQGGRDHDYARKQWSGLISGHDIPRAKLYRQQALSDAQAGTAFDYVAVTQKYARMSYEWQTDVGPNVGPVAPVEDPVEVSVALRKKWAPYFSACDGV